jgi:protein-tyrosine phosphatase
MVDIHSHILWGLDDGARSLEQSVSMLTAAAAAGTTDIVATPHSNGEYEFKPELIQQRIEELRQASGELPNLHTGCDFHLSFENIEDAFANPARYTINHLNYLLVEFPDLHIATSMDTILSRFVEMGIIPIVTHPERNAVLQQSLPRLKSWVENGCLVQVTGLSLLGGFGRQPDRFAWELMDRGLVHFIASDCHDPEGRHARLDEVRRTVAERRSEPEAERLLVSNPSAVLKGLLLPEEPEDPDTSKKKSWFAFWR